MSRKPMLNLFVLVCLGCLAGGWRSSSARGQDPPGLGPAGDLLRIEFDSAGPAALDGANARKQLLVTAVHAGGQLRDVTRECVFESSPAGVLQVDADGFVTPLTDGHAVVRATGPEGQTAEIELETTRCNQETPVHFVNEIVPIFTRQGCNGGGCHGKSDGQNGFKLSLLGFYPEDDYQYLVHESRGRRIFPRDPEFSLLLQKPANLAPHGGGKRLEPGSYQWDLIVQWIRQGMPYGSEQDPVLQRIEAVPPVRVMNFDARQQLSVIAHYSDGSRRDVTRLATYESNQPEMAEVSSDGRVKVWNTPGEAAVMIRFQGQVAVFRAVLPQGIEVAATPPLRSFIDELVFARLKQLGIPPSDLCSDEEFLRRATIDIAGRLPTFEETREFLADDDPQKRDAVVDRLVDSPGYADYFANKWSAVLRNKRRNNNDIPYTHRFHAWIRDAMLNNTPYDAFVRSVLTASGDVATHPPVAWYREVATSSQQMEDTAQLFLGMRLACAKCHHHPFEQWSQQDYYGLEAFFSQVDLKASRLNPQANKRDMVYVKGVEPSATNPRTRRQVPPTGLGGEPLEIPAWEDARHALVDWMTADENPFFAKALVNRYWKHFLGRGIVDPEDDLRVTNPPSNPELLEALAAHFRDRHFDLKDLVRTICKSSVYQLSSEPNQYNAKDEQNFSRFYPRRLSAEVLYDAINSVAGSEASFGGAPRGYGAVQLPDNGFSNYFLQVFGKPEAESACECERSAEANLAQSLHLLNSSDVQTRLQSGGSTPATWAADKDRQDLEKISEAYLRAFARQPTAEEIELVQRHLAGSDNIRQAWEDVLWAIFNSKEFQFVR